MYETRQHKDKVSRRIEKSIQKMSKDGSMMTTTNASNNLVTGKVLNNPILPNNMTRHHIIPRNKLADFWNKVKENNHLIYLSPAIHNLVDNAIKRNVNNNIVDLQVDGNTITTVRADDYMNIMHNYSGHSLEPYISAELPSVIETVFQWWPANIHYGPTERLSPGFDGYDKDRDDGGDDFEESARKVVKESTFNTLRNINNRMETYKNNSNVKELRIISRLISNLSTIKNATPYDEKQWTHERVSRKWYWRFK